MQSMGRCANGLTSKVLELCTGQQGVQGMTEFMKQCLGLVRAHQATA